MAKSVDDAIRKVVKKTMRKAGKKSTAGPASYAAPSGTAFAILSRGEKFAAAGDGVFVKDVLRVGKWIHPRTGRVVDVDQARLERLAAATNLYLGTVGKVPGPDGHKWEAAATLGTWHGPFEVIGDRLFARARITDSEARRKVSEGSIDAVSVVIEPDHLDQSGHRHEEVITQVAFTAYPVVTQQGPFTQLSGIDENGDIAIFQPYEAPTVQTSIDSFAEILMSAKIDVKAGEKVAEALAALAVGPEALEGTFDDCVQSVMTKQGMPMENAQRICAVAKRKAGEIP